LLNILYSGYDSTPRIKKACSTILQAYKKKVEDSGLGTLEKLAEAAFE
jgi:hypothetical protein